MMKKLFNKKGLGLLETVIAIAILAAIALPLLNVFVSYARADEKAQNVLSANYISQDYTETLETMTYQQALSSAPYRLEVDGYYLTAKIEPYGSVSDSSSSQISYFNFIIYDDGSMMAVMPDGQWTVFSSVPASISFTRVANNYTFTGGSTTIIGEMEYSYSVITINAMRQTSAVTLDVSTTSDFKPVLYCKSSYTSGYTFDSVYEIIEDLLTQDTSLVHVTTYVYEDALSNEEISSIESYITIKNWE